MLNDMTVSARRKAQINQSTNRLAKIMLYFKRFTYCMFPLKMGILKIFIKALLQGKLCNPLAVSRIQPT